MENAGNVLMKHHCLFLYKKTFNFMVAAKSFPYDKLCTIKKASGTFIYEQSDRKVTGKIVGSDPSNILRGLNLNEVHFCDFIPTDEWLHEAKGRVIRNDGCVYVGNDKVVNYAKF